MNPARYAFGFAFFGLVAACTITTSDDGADEADVDVEGDLSGQAWPPKKDAGKDTGPDTGGGADSGGGGTDAGTDARDSGPPDTGPPPPPPYEDACLLPGSTQPTLIPYGYISADGMDEGASAATPLPFAFSFAGQSQSHYWVTSNGELGFGTDARGLNFAQVPSCAFPHATVTRPQIFVYGADLIAGTVCVATTGAAPNRRLVVTWKEKVFYENNGTMLTFGAVLNEGSNRVDIRVNAAVQLPSNPDPVSYNGGWAVIALQRGSTSQVFSCFQQLAPPGTLFTYQ